MVGAKRLVPTNGSPTRKVSNCVVWATSTLNDSSGGRTPASDLKGRNVKLPSVALTATFPPLLGSPMIV